MSLEEFIYKLLDNALDSGITELEYWEMTPAEVERSIMSKARVRKIEAQERASYDYILATLISKGVSVVLGDKQPFPDIREAYPTLFNDETAIAAEEELQEKKMQLSALRFKQFAQSYNENLKNKGVLNG
jgi:hypothetical protein